MTQMLEALASHPETIAVLLREFEKVEAGEGRLTDMVSGFMEPETISDDNSLDDEGSIADSASVAANDDSESEDSEGSRSDGVEALSDPDLERTRVRMAILQESHEWCTASMAKHGKVHAKTKKLRSERTEYFMECKLASKMVGSLVTSLRRLVDRIRE